MSGIGFRRNFRGTPGDAGDWRHAIWNRWLISYLTPKEEDDEETRGPVRGTEFGFAAAPPTEAATNESEGDGSAEQVPKTGEAADVPNATGPGAGETPPLVAQPTEAAAAPPGLSPDSAFPNRASARARLDSLLDQVFALEGTVDALVQRIQRSSSQERLEIRRVSDALERVLELQERHTDALLSCTRAIERFERRLMSLERHALSRPFADPRPTLGSFHSDLPRSTELESRESQAPSLRPKGPLSASRPVTDGSQNFGGNLGDLSLPTLLGMFELEHRTGTLDIETEDQRLSVELEAGKLVRVVQSGAEVDAVESLATVIDSRTGRFLFTPTPKGADHERTMSVGSVLLRISQKNDEDKRVLYAT